MGAIGNCIKDLAYFKTTKSTNAIDFKEFIKDLLQRMQLTEGRRPTIVLDNHSAHIEKNSVKLLQEHFNVCFIVPHTPASNSIESLWGKIKELLANKLLLRKDRLQTQDEVVQLVLDTAHEYVRNKAAVLGILRANRSWLLKWVGEGNEDE